MSDEGQDVDISPEERAEINGMFLRLANANYYELLGVGPDADRKAIREAYFTLSQRFHPDVWFGKNIGAWKPRMEVIFREVTKAYDVLSNRNHRAAYDASIGMSARTQDAAAALASRTPLNPQPAPTTSQSSANTAAAPATVIDPVSSPNAARPTSGSYRAQQPPSASLPPAARTGAHPVQPANPIITPPVDPNAPIVPDRNLRVTAPVVPPTNMNVRTPHIDPEVARRAAREALARKMGAGSISTGRFQAVKDPNVVLKPSTSEAMANSSTMMSLQNARTARNDAERVAKLDHYIALADESARRGDAIGASNALQLAMTIAPEDATLRARAEEAARKTAEILADRYIEQARQAESQGRFDAAADLWLRAAAGRPRDNAVLVRAATILHRSGKDAQKAAELAKRAAQLVPRVETFALLVDIYLSAKMKASAHAAAEAAAKLDPTSPIVKDLLARAK